MAPFDFCFVFTFWLLWCDYGTTHQRLRRHLGRFASHTGLFLKNSCKHLYIEEMTKKKSRLNWGKRKKKSQKFKAFNTLAHLNLLYMHRFSWRMATVQMRLMLHGEQIGRSECVYHHGPVLNTTRLICLQRLCEHTFCHRAMQLPLFFVCPCVCLCVVHSHVICHRAATSVCVHKPCVY